MTARELAQTLDGEERGDIHAALDRLDYAAMRALADLMEGYGAAIGYQRARDILDSIRAGYTS